MIKFICYPKCTTCIKAKNWLDSHNIEYELRDIKLDRPSHDEIKSWYGTSVLPLKRFFNTSGVKYKELGLKDRLAEMDEEEQMLLLASDGMLVKRPIAVGDGFVLLGFRESDWAKAMLHE